MTKIGPDLLHRLRFRERARSAVRAFFQDRNVLEVDTPHLVIGGGLEPHIDPFEVSVRMRPDLPGQRRYLHTSPELSMKKLLAAGSGDIYQLCRVFRDGERTDTHLPEFSMIEWYRTGMSLETLADDAISLFRAVADVLGQRPAWVESEPLHCTVTDAFTAYAEVDLKAVLEAPDQDLAMCAAATQRGIHLRPGADFEDAFFAVMDKFVEPSFPKDKATVLSKWPACMAALAEIDKSGLYADRFEIYAVGYELANAFSELRNPAEQMNRFTESNRIRRELGKGELIIDGEFISALSDMPPTVGIAVGFERLLMALTGVKTIDEVSGLQWT